MDSRDKFAQMLTEGYKALDPDREEREYIRELLRQREQQRKKRIRTITALAAAFLIVIGAVFAVGGCIGPVEADKNDKTKVEKHDGSVVIKGENTGDEEIGAEVAKVTDWEGIAELKQQYPEMITFTDVPEGMEFVSVEVVKQVDGIIRVSYDFKLKNEPVYICQKYNFKQQQETKGVENGGEYKEYNRYKVKIEKGNDSILVTAISEQGVIDVMGKVTEKDVCGILNKIQASD